MTAKKRKLTQKEKREFKAFLRHALAIAGNLHDLSERTGLSWSTIQRLTRRDYVGTHTTRAKIETYVENNKHLLR